MPIHSRMDSDRQEIQQYGPEGNPRLLRQTAVLHNLLAGQTTWVQGVVRDVLSDHWRPYVLPTAVHDELPRAMLRELVSYLDINKAKLNRNVCNMKKNTRSSLRKLSMKAKYTTLHCVLLDFVPNMRWADVVVDALIFNGETTMTLLARGARVRAMPDDLTPPPGGWSVLEKAYYLQRRLQAMINLAGDAQVVFYKDVQLMTGKYKHNPALLAQAANRVALLNLILDAKDEDGIGPIKDIYLPLIKLKAAPLAGFGTSAVNGMPELICKLVGTGCVDVNERDPACFGMTLMHKVCADHASCAVATLLQHGADVWAQIAPTEGGCQVAAALAGYTPAHMAVNRYREAYTKCNGTTTTFEHTTEIQNDSITISGRETLVNLLQVDPVRLVHLKSSGQGIKAKTPGQLVKNNKQLKQLFDECLQQALLVQAGNNTAVATADFPAAHHNHEGQAAVSEPHSIDGGNSVPLAHTSPTNGVLDRVPMADANPFAHCMSTAATVTPTASGTDDEVAAVAAATTIAMVSDINNATPASIPPTKECKIATTAATAPAALGNSAATAADTCMAESAVAAVAAMAAPHCNMTASTTGTIHSGMSTNSNGAAQTCTGSAHNDRNINSNGTVPAQTCTGAHPAPVATPMKDPKFTDMHFRTCLGVLKAVKQLAKKHGCTDTPTVTDIMAFMDAREMPLPKGVRKVVGSGSQGYCLLVDIGGQKIARKLTFLYKGEKLDYSDPNDAGNPCDDLAAVYYTAKEYHPPLPADNVLRPTRAYLADKASIHKLANAAIAEQLAKTAGVAAILVLDTPYASGGDLDGYLQKTVSLDGRCLVNVRQMIQFYIDGLTAVITMRKSGYVHGDVKPANCFLSRDGEAGTGNVPPLEGYYQGLWRLMLGDTTGAAFANEDGKATKKQFHTPIYQPQYHRPRVYTSPCNTGGDVNAIGITMCSFLYGVEVCEAGMGALVQVAIAANKEHRAAVQAAKQLREEAEREKEVAPKLAAYGIHGANDMETKSEQKLDYAMLLPGILTIMKLFSMGNDAQCREAFSPVWDAKLISLSDYEKQVADVLAYQGAECMQEGELVDGQIPAGSVLQKFVRRMYTYFGHHDTEVVSCLFEMHRQIGACMFATEPDAEAMLESAMALRNVISKPFAYVAFNTAVPEPNCRRAHSMKACEWQTESGLDKPRGKKTVHPKCRQNPQAPAGKAMQPAVLQVVDGTGPLASAHPIEPQTPCATATASGASHQPVVSEADTAGHQSAHTLETVPGEQADVPSIPDQMQAAQPLSVGAKSTTYAAVPRVPPGFEGAAAHASSAYVAMPQVPPPTAFTSDVETYDLMPQPSPAMLQQPHGTPGFQAQASYWQAMQQQNAAMLPPPYGTAGFTTQASYWQAMQQQNAAMLPPPHGTAGFTTQAFYWQAMQQQNSAVLQPPHGRAGVTTQAACWQAMQQQNPIWLQPSSNVAAFPPQASYQQAMQTPQPVKCQAPPGFTAVPAVQQCFTATQPPSPEPAAILSPRRVGVCA